MKCPICGEAQVRGAERCPYCGFRYQNNTYTAPQEQSRPRRKKRGGCCLAAFLISLVILGLLTAAVFSTLRGFETVVSPAVRETRPQTPTIAVQPELPVASEDCFVLVDGALKFLPEAWDGSPMLQVPDTVNGQTVTAIGYECFADCDFLTTIVLPESVTVIHPRAFAGCTELRGLYVPESTELIGEDAFSGCISLEAVYIPTAVDSIASGCFDDCASLLYIFYGGMFEDWNALYSDYINPFTTAICLDGYYYHGTQG